MACNRGDPPSHWCPQQRLTIHMYETLCSPETRSRRHRTSVSSGAAACVFLGTGMTLAVPGSAGFVVLAQRAVIGRSDVEARVRNSMPLRTVSQFLSHSSSSAGVR